MAAEESRGDARIDKYPEYPASKKLVYALLGLLIVYVIVRGLAAAAARPLWFDELLTLAIAGQPSLRAMQNAVSRGFDAMPVAFYVVERAALGLTRNQEIALRLPSILAFPCILICVFVYTKKRCGEAIAFLAALLLLSSSLFHTYLIEARPYSMLMACIAFALICYQRLPSRLWTVMLGGSLLVAESLHSLAVFSMIPFGLAETAVLLKTRRFRWPVWIALAAGAIPLIVSWPALMKLKAYYGPNVFSRPLLYAVRAYYGRFFLVNDVAIGVGLVAVAAVAVLWSRRWPQLGPLPQNRGNDADPVEATLLLSLIALPFISFVLVRLAHGTLLNRYVLATTVGIAIGVASAVAIAGRKAALIFAVFIFCVVGVRQVTFWRNMDLDPFPPQFSATSHRQIQQILEFVRNDGGGDLPVVVSDFLLYSQLARYSDPILGRRLIYLTDERRELKYTSSDNASKTMSAAHEFLSVPVANFSGYIAAHQEFFLYSEGMDWYSHAFTDEGFLVQPLAMGEGTLYRVKVIEARSH